MNDTTPEIEDLFNQMIMKKSGQERMMMGFSIQEIRREIFLRFYGHEFSPEEQDKILKRIL